MKGVRSIWTIFRIICLEKLYLGIILKFLFFESKTELTEQGFILKCDLTIDQNTH